jgi:CRISPR/Cas system-associated endonuclease Cas1
MEGGPMTIEELIRKCSEVSEKFEYTIRLGPSIGTSQGTLIYQWTCISKGERCTAQWQAFLGNDIPNFGPMRLLEEALKVLTERSQTPEQKRIAELEKRVTRCERYLPNPWTGGPR